MGHGNQLVYGIRTSCGVHLGYLGAFWLDVKRLGRKMTTDTHLMPELKMNGAVLPFSLISANRHNFICSGSLPGIKNN